MNENENSNQLYLAALPLIHIGEAFGRTEQVLTLFPDRNFATAFYPDDADGFIRTFQNRMASFTGGHVTGYEFIKEETTHGKVIVRVIQRVK
jgi:hypothetical protein